MKACDLLLDSRYNRPDGSPGVARVGLVVGKHKAQKMGTRNKNEQCSSHGYRNAQYTYKL